MRGGRVALLLAAASLGLAACGPIHSAGDVVAAAPSKIEQAQEAYEGAKAFAELLLPLLPADRQARIRELEGKIERLLWFARTASTIAAQAAAVDQANDAIAELSSPAT